MSLTLDSGERQGLAGESGCGKTTLLRAIVGLLPASARIGGTFQLQGPVAYIPQEGLNSLSPFLTVGRQVLDVTRSTEECARLLAQVRLAGERFYRAYPHQLSGGERQRVLLALALAMKPRLIVADEPTANLDSDSESVVLAVLDFYLRATGAAILIASHRERVFQKLGCTVLRMTPAHQEAPLAPLQPGVKRPPLLSIRGLTKVYTERDWRMRTRPVLRALDRVSVEIGAGEWLAITGPSGAGKSTLARCIAGREQGDSGSLEWHVSTPAADRVQLVQQEPSESLNPQFSLGQALLEAGAGDNPELLAGIGLPPVWWSRKVSALSEGQRARLAILRTAARLKRGPATPALLILDESLSGLDPATRASILAFLRALCEQQRLSLLLITHDLEVARQAGARILHISGGRIAA